MSRVLKLALLGDPLSHSLSPRMQSAALAAAHLEGSYELIRCPSGELADRLPRLAAEGFTGLNLTLPLKEEACSLLERLSPEARRLGAVNTLRLGAAGWEGHNTDLEGFAWAAREHFGDLRNLRALVLGAGGAARAVVAALADAALSRVDILNRDPLRARKLASALATEGVEIRAVTGLAQSADADILIQATSLGLRKEDPLPPLPLPGRSPAVMDLITHATPWLAACKKLGCRVADGRLMLAGQGAAAFAYWTGTSPPRQVMLEALRGD